MVNGLWGSGLDTFTRTEILNLSEKIPFPKQNKPSALLVWT